MGEGTITVNVTHQTTKEKIQKSFELGDTLAELLEKWGEECVFTNAIIGMKTQLRNRLYTITHTSDEDGEPQAADAAAALAMVEGWKPTTVGVREAKDPLDAVLKKFRSLSKEDQVKVLESLRS